MAWNMKGGSWDLRELDEGGISNLETMRVDNYNSRSSRFGLVKGSSSSSSGGEFCVDLKLGSHVANSMSVPSGTKLKTSVSKTGGKRGRGMNNNNGDQKAWCMVDGCSSDMSKCREYHRRHKVCELHSKTPVVTIGGLNQRFCQQCSRFHSLEEFDEGKRSCRKRLDGHNRRRRKPQPAPLTPSTLFSSYHQGRHLVPFSSNSNMYTSSALVNPGCDWEWDGRTVVYHNNSNSSCSSNKQQIFMGSSESSRIKQDVSMAMPAGSSSFSSPPLCALSLLSSPPAPMYLSQPLATASALRDHSLQEAVDTTLVVSNGTQPSMYNLFGSSSHSLPFHWG